jgi:hypothetical protein
MKMTAIWDGPIESHSLEVNRRFTCAYTSIIKVTGKMVEAVYTSKTWVHFYEITRHLIPDAVIFMHCGKSSDGTGGPAFMAASFPMT